METNDVLLYILQTIHVPITRSLLMSSPRRNQISTNQVRLGIFFHFIHTVQNSAKSRANLTRNCSIFHLFLNLICLCLMSSLVE